MVFSVEVDDEEGCARRTCVTCGQRAFIADSAEFWDEADSGESQCPCGEEAFELGVAFSLREDGDVRWTLSVGAASPAGF